MYIIIWVVLLVTVAFLLYIKKKASETVKSKVPTVKSRGSGSNKRRNVSKK